MAEAKIIIGRVKTRKDSYLNWRANDPYLLEGEVAIATNNSMNTLNGMSMLVFGDGTKSFTELVAGERTDEHYPTGRSNNNAVFYSGVGAGYTLPTATTDKLGGIKLNTDYFKLDNNDKLQPVLYKIGGTEDFPTIEFDKRYRGVFNDLEWVKSYDSIGFTLILNDVHGDSEKVLEPMGSENPYAGTVVQYYKKSGNNKLNSFIGINENGIPLVSKNYLLVDDGTGHNDAFMKQIVTLDLNANSGIVWCEGLDNFSTVPVYPMSLKLFVDGYLQEEIEYNPLSPDNSPIYVNTVENYCTNITVNGVTYNLSDNHNINLGASIWTDTERDKLNIAVSDISDINKDLEDIETRIPVAIQYLGTNYILEEGQKFVINPSLENIVPISSSTNTIIVKVNNESGKEQYELEHYDVNPDVDKFFYEVTVGSNTEGGEVDSIIGVGQLVCDEYGHLTKVSLNQYKMNNLINRISELETSNSNLTKQISELTNKNNALTNDIDGLKEQLKQATNSINDLTERVINLENNNIEGE